MQKIQETNNDCLLIWCINVFKRVKVNWDSRLRHFFALWLCLHSDSLLYDGCHGDIIVVFWNDGDVGIGSEEGAGVEDKGQERFVESEPPVVGWSSGEGGEEEEEEREEERSEDGWVGG